MPAFPESAGMLKNRFPFLLPAITLFVGLPATLAFLYYLFTYDPTLRPLGVSRADAEKFDRPLADLEIVIDIYWGDNAKAAYDKDQLAGMITKALKVYDVNYRLRWRDNLGTDILTSIKVDDIQLGPVPVSDLAGAIPAAISAYRSSAKN